MVQEFHVELVSQPALILNTWTRPVKSLHYLLFTLETYLTRLTATLTYGYKTETFRALFDHMSIQQNSGSRLTSPIIPRNNEFLSHGLLTRSIYYTGHVFSLVEQASDPIRKWLATLFPPSCLHSTLCHYESELLEEVFVSVPT